MGTVLRRFPQYDARTDAVGHNHSEAVHHLCGAEAILLPQLHKGTCTGRTRGGIRSKEIEN